MLLHHLLSFAMTPLPLPRTAEAAASQAAAATQAALSAAAGGACRLQININGDAVEDAGALPLLALCARLVDVLGGDARWHASKMHFVFDGSDDARAWQQLAPVAAARSRWSHLAQPEGLLPDDDALVVVLVAPCNRMERSAPGSKLSAVQQIICGAQSVPVILLNPDLEAHLLTQRVGRAVPPMFLSDFEHAFFLAEAQAKTGYVTAVRRVWGHAWEVYRVVQSRSSSSRTAALERTQREPERFDRKPRSADALALYARRRHRARGERGRDARMPGRTTDAAWAAEGGWAR